MDYIKKISKRKCQTEGKLHIILMYISAKYSAFANYFIFFNCWHPFLAKDTQSFACIQRAKKNLAAHQHTQSAASSISCAQNGAELITAVTLFLIVFFSLVKCLFN